MASPSTFDIAALGEVLLRLSAPPGARLQATSRLDLFVGGAEANVVSALARLEHRCALASVLPDTQLGRLAAGSLRASGVDLSHLAWKAEGRMGLYFLEYGHGVRATEVLYDRRHSCFSEAAATEIDFGFLSRTKLFHTTGITAALGPAAFALVEQALDGARGLGTPCSFDVNFRGRLWPAEEAAGALPRLMEGAEILFCAARDAALLWGLAGAPESVCRGLQELCGARHVLLTAGEEGAYLRSGGGLLHEAARSSEMVDRIGAGDALAAGVIHGWLAGDMALGLRCGVTLAALAASHFGDMAVTTRRELEALADHSSGGLVR